MRINARIRLTYRYTRCKRIGNACCSSFKCGCCSNPHYKFGVPGRWQKFHKKKNEEAKLLDKKFGLKHIKDQESKKRKFCYHQIPKPA